MIKPKVKNQKYPRINQLINSGNDVQYSMSHCLILVKIVGRTVLCNTVQKKVNLNAPVLHNTVEPKLVNHNKRTTIKITQRKSVQYNTSKPDVHCIVQYSTKKCQSEHVCIVQYSEDTNPSVQYRKPDVHCIVQYSTKKCQSEHVCIVQYSEDTNPSVQYRKPRKYNTPRVQYSEEPDQKVQYRKPVQYNTLKVDAHCTVKYNEDQNTNVQYRKPVKVNTPRIQYIENLVHLVQYRKPVQYNTLRVDAHCIVQYSTKKCQVEHVCIVQYSEENQYMTTIQPTQESSTLTNNQTNRRNEATPDHQTSKPPIKSIMCYTLKIH